MGLQRVLANVAARLPRVRANRRRSSGSLGGERAVAIGNGANDADMQRAAMLGIAVVGPEGLAGGALAAADVVVASINDALGLLVNSKHSSRRSRVSRQPRQMQFPMLFNRV